MLLKEWKVLGNQLFSNEVVRDPRMNFVQAAHDQPSLLEISPEIDLFTSAVDYIVVNRFGKPDQVQSSESSLSHVHE